MRKLGLWLAVLGCGLAAGAAELKNGESIAFLGDSITQYGWNLPSGYVRMIDAALWANDLRGVKLYPAGVSGHKSDQMLARLERDVLKRKPTYLVLSCGVNDVWHPFLYPGRGKGVSLEDYKKNMTAIVDQAQAAGIKVILLTATMIKEDADNPENRALAPYNDFLRELAKQKNCKLVDLNAEMQRLVAEARAASPGKRNRLTVDGVHMDVAGNEMMADGILRALGFTDEEMKKTHDAYPVRLQYETRAHRWIRLPQYEKIKAKADAADMTVPDFIRQEYIKMIDKLAE